MEAAAARRDALAAGFSSLISVRTTSAVLTISSISSASSSSTSGAGLFVEGFAVVVDEGGSMTATPCASEAVAGAALLAVAAIALTSSVVVMVGCAFTSEAAAAR